jgi:hypothetical protein
VVLEDSTEQDFHDYDHLDRPDDVWDVKTGAFEVTYDPSSEIDERVYHEIEAAINQLLS